MLMLTCYKTRCRIKNVASPSCCQRMFSPPEEVKIPSSHCDIEPHRFSTPSHGVATPAAQGLLVFHMFGSEILQKAHFDRAEMMLFDATVIANDG